MGPETVNKNRDSNFYGPYAGRDLYITMFQDTEREFVVTHNANIKPVSYFAGRETELQELRQRIEEGRKSVLVSGMGGIGKTHICRKLFEEYLNKHAVDENGTFRHLGYIEYNGDMGSSLMNCLKFKQQDDPEQNHEAAWRELEYLAADGELLLFVDNVDKPISADLGLQRLKGIPGAIVLTSRQSSFGDEFEPYRIGFLSMQQCKEIYEKIRFGNSGKKIKPEEVPDLEYVIESLAGRHTITVELLAHLARTKLWAVKRLREELEKKGFWLTFHKDGEFVNIQESYEVLYDLSELTNTEQNILEAFSVFPYIPLAAETCNEWLLSDAGVSEDDDILMGLYQKGWLQFDAEQDGYALHPVFAQFIYERCRPEVEKHYGLISNYQKILTLVKGDSILEFHKYILFGESVAKKLDMGKNIEQASFIAMVGYFLYSMDEYNRAEKLYEKYLMICKAVLKENHPNIAKSYNNVAMMYVKQGKYEKARKFFFKSLQIQKGIRGGASLETAASYNGLAMMYLDQGECEKSEELFRESLRIWEKILGEDHLETAKGYNNLAVVYEKQKKYKNARELYEKLLRIWEKILGANHPETAKGYNNLGLLCANQGEYNKAKKLYERSLNIHIRVFGRNHSALVAIYNNLATVFKEQRDYFKALDYYLEAYRVVVYRIDLNHPHTQLVYENMKMAYYEWNPEGNFEQWLEEKIKEANVG